MFAKHQGRGVPEDGWSGQKVFPGVWTSKDVKVPRNQQKRPRILMPDGKLKVYSRPSGAGGILEDHEQLQRWQIRNAGLGLSASPELALKFRDLADVHGEDAREADSLLQQAQVLAGSEDRSAYGTDLHELTERVDMGLPVAPLTAGIGRDLDAYIKCRDMLGLEIHAVEVFGVLDEWSMAGTIDRVGTFPGAGLADDELAILDVKTSGKWKPRTEHMHELLKYSRGKFAIQMAIYQQLQQYNLESGERRDLIPGYKISDKWGFIIHIPATLGMFRVERVDLQRGRDGIELVRDVKEWRNSWQRVSAVGETMIEGTVKE